MTISRAAAHFLLFGWCVVSTKADIVFKGFFTSDAGTVFALSTKEETKTRWVKTGQHFEGYTVTAFDPKTTVLTVEKEGRREHLPLEEAKIGVARQPMSDIPLKGQIVVTIGNETLSIDPGSPIERLQPRLAALAKQSPQPKLLINAPSDSSIERIRGLIDLCRKCGFKRFALKTDEISVDRSK